jgi:hypothetical protein
MLQSNHFIRDKNKVSLRMFMENPFSLVQDTAKQIDHEYMTETEASHESSIQQIRFHISVSIHSYSTTVIATATWQRWRQI